MQRKNVSNSESEFEYLSSIETGNGTESSVHIP